MARRLLSIWLPRFASEMSLRARPVEGPFALTLRSANADRLHCLTPAAEARGLSRGMGLADARALCPGLLTRPADPRREAMALAALARWAGRYGPQVAPDGPDGLIVDSSGVAHLFGGEEALLADLRIRLARSGLTATAALAETRGAAHALARHGGGVLPPGTLIRGLSRLPVAALRLPEDTAAGLARLGLSRIGDLIAQPRAPLARRFGPTLMLRLDQALGIVPEPVAAPPDAARFAARMTLPEPIGLAADVRAGLDRLLQPLCAKLARHGRGARRLRLELRRVDRATAEVEIGLARPMHDPARLAALFARGIDEVDAGFGIDALRLSAPETEPLPPRQTAHVPAADPPNAAPARPAEIGVAQIGAAEIDMAGGQAFGPPAGRSSTGVPGFQAASGITGANPRGAGIPGTSGEDRLADLLSRLGNRLGFDRVLRLLPAESLIPERSFLTAAAAYSTPAPTAADGPPRPATIFPPEPVQETPAAGPTTAAAPLPEAAAGTPPEYPPGTDPGAPLSSGALLGPDCAPAPRSGGRPPASFRWRRRLFTTLRAAGPERIAPEWWFDDPAWRSGLRDYWRIETQEGPRLWLFHTPQQPAWHAQGEFA